MTILQSLLLADICNFVKLVIEEDEKSLQKYIVAPKKKQFKVRGTGKTLSKKVFSVFVYREEM